MPLRIFFIFKQQNEDSDTYTTDQMVRDFRDGISDEIAYQYIKKKFGEPSRLPGGRSPRAYAEITHSQRVNVAPGCITPEDIHKVLVDDTASTAN